MYPIGLRKWVREKLNLKVEEEEEWHPGKLRNADRKYLLKKYPLDIAETDEVCRFIRAVAGLGSQHNIKILFYVSPLNQQYLKEVGYFDPEAFEASMMILLIWASIIIPMLENE